MQNALVEQSRNVESQQPVNRKEILFYMVKTWKINCNFCSRLNSSCCCRNGKIVISMVHDKSRAKSKKEEKKRTESAASEYHVLQTIENWTNANGTSCARQQVEKNNGGQQTKNEIVDVLKLFCILHFQFFVHSFQWLHFTKHTQNFQICVICSDFLYVSPFLYHSIQYELVVQLCDFSSWIFCTNFPCVCLQFLNIFIVVMEMLRFNVTL